MHDHPKNRLALDLLSAFFQIKPRSTMPHADATTPWFHKRFGADRTKKMNSHSTSIAKSTDFVYCE